MYTGCHQRSLEVQQLWGEVDTQLLAYCIGDILSCNTGLRALTFDGLQRMQG